MKTMITIIALGLGVNLANAQKLKEADVPSAVKDAFKKEHPNTKVEKYEKDGSNYEIEFEVKDVETCLVYDASGKLLETEIEININQLPDAVKQAAEKKMPGKKIKEASKITTVGGLVSYELEIENKDLLFSSDGVFQKEENDVDEKGED